MNGLINVEIQFLAGDKLIHVISMDAFKIWMRYSSNFDILRYYYVKSKK